MSSKLRDDIVFETINVVHSNTSFLEQLESLKSKSEILFEFQQIKKSFLESSQYSLYAYKVLIYYGVTYGLSKRDEQLLKEMLPLIHLQCKNQKLLEFDKFTFLVLFTRVCAELFNLTQNLIFTVDLTQSLIQVENILKSFPMLKGRLGWDHFLSGKMYACKSQISSSDFYKNVGKSFLFLFRHGNELSDLIKAHHCLTQAISEIPHCTESLGSLAEILEELGKYFGNPNYLEKALMCLSHAIFFSFNSSKKNEVYQHYCCRYAIVCVNLYKITFQQQHFFQAQRVLAATTQNFPQIAHLWIVWGELLLHFGWTYNDVSFVEQGLEKLSVAQKKRASALQLTSLFAQGLAIIGLLLEEPHFIKESREKLLQVTKLFSKNFSFLEAFGVAQLCYATYFQDNSAFLSAATCFSSYISTNPYNVDARQKLFDVYYFWALAQNNIFLLKKALIIGKKITKLCPYVFVYWEKLGKLCLRLAKLSEDMTNRELHLEQAIFFFQRALTFSFNHDLLESLGYTKYLLGVLRDSVDLLDEAYECLTKTRVILPFSSLTKLSEILLEKGRCLNDDFFIKEALQLLTFLLQNRHDEERVLVLLGKAWLYLFWKTKSYYADEQAGLYLNQALHLGSNEAYFHLSQLYSLKNNVMLSWQMLVKSVNFGFKLTKEEWLRDPLLDSVRMHHQFHEISFTKRA